MRFPFENVNSPKSRGGLMFDDRPPWVIETVDRANRLIVDWRWHAEALVRRHGLGFQTVPRMEEQIVLGVVVEKILFQRRRAPIKRPEVAEDLNSNFHRQSCACSICCGACIRNTRFRRTEPLTTNSVGS